MSQSRKVPAFASQTFRAWFPDRASRNKSSEKRVLFWVDTFNDHFHPEALRAAVRVLEHLGFTVEIPAKALCCGRPLYDFGMLDDAKLYLERTLDTLAPTIDAEIPMVILEPELLALLPTRVTAKKLAAQTFTLAQFLEGHASLDGYPQLRRKAIAQVHCHQHAVLKYEAEKKVLAAIGIDVEVLRSGCCGMAGSFGFEADKLEVSQACGERVLLRRVRDADPATLIIADGFSCKTQIANNGARRGLHLAEIMALALDQAEIPSRDEPFVESQIVDPPARAVRRGTRIAAAALLTFVVFVALGTALAIFGARELHHHFETSIHQGEAR